MLAAAIARRLTPDDGAATTPGPQRPVDAWTTLGDFERLNVRPCRPYFVRSLATSIPDFNCICVPKIRALSASMWSGFGFLAMGPGDFGGTADAHDA